jgi:hypothetical protein
MSALWNSPFLLLQGHQKVFATVETLNVVGYSPSAINIVGADVRTEPLQPVIGPQRNSAGTTDTRIKVDYGLPVDP